GHTPHSLWSPAVVEQETSDEATAGEPAAAGRRRAGHAWRTADGVVQEPAAGGQELEAPLEVDRQLSQSDVLEHADRADGVVGAVVDIPVVLVPHLHFACQPGLGGALLGQLRLPLR